MGLLDEISAALPDLLPADPNQREAAKMGLLNFGAAMLANNRNGLGNSLGQGIGAGTQAYGQQLQQQGKNDLQKLQVQGLTLENQGKQQALDKQAGLTRIYQGLSPQTASISSTPQPLPVNAPTEDSSAFQVSPKPIWLQPAKSDATDPAISNTAMPAQAAAPAAAAPITPVTNSDLYSQQVELGKRLEQAGYPDEALKHYKAAQDFKTKFNSQKTLTQNGKPVNVVTYDDGTQKASEFGPAPNNQIVNFGGTQGVVDKDTGQVGATFQNTRTPDSIANTNSAAAARAQTERHFQITNAASDAPSDLGRAAIVNAAARYNMDGTLPPMGMGKQGAAGRTAILNEAAAQAGVNGTDQRVTQLANKANAAALSKLQQSQTMVGAFEKNFTRNADMALGLSDGVGNTGVPIANQWLNSGRRAVGGDPKLAAYDIAIKSTLNEYAKIVSGSMGNTSVAQSEIKKAEELLNSAQTAEQVKAAISTMKQETKNRMAGFDEEKAALRAQMGGGSAASSDRAAPAAAAAPANLMAVLPPANLSNKGRTIIDHDTGKRLVSDGMQWKESK